MASKIVAFSPTPLVSNKLSRSSGKPIGPCSVIFPSGKPSGLAVVRAQSNGDTKHNCTSLDVCVSNNQGTTMMEQRLRRRWALHASPIGKYSAEEQKWTEEGLVIESLPDGKFQVQLDNGVTILGYLSGKMRQRFIRVMPGDRVRLDLNRYDLSKGRITYRLRNKDKVVNKELEE